MRLIRGEPLATAAAVREVRPAPAWPACLELVRRAPGFWLLESALPTPRLGCYHFAGAAPYARVQASGLDCEVVPLRPARADLPARPTRISGDPFAMLRAVLPAAPREVPPEAPPFVGGAVGWCGYELAAHLEAVALPDADGLDAPDLCWWLVDRLWALECETGRLLACTLGFAADPGAAQARADRAADALAERTSREDSDPFQAYALAGTMRTASPGPVRAGPSLPPHRLHDSATGLTLHGFFDKGTYVKTVGTIQERIVEGDVYQANLTHRLDVAYAGDPWRLYQGLRARNPAPFAAYLTLPGLAVVGSSPERFLRLDAQRFVESRPIKGTRPRGRSPAEDAALHRALASSPKDRAENLMIVDLVRNDLGRVCEFGSVRAPELMEIERYATVHQMVSTVTGRLRSDQDIVDLLRAAFPPGSMTGAPKIAAIQILARLEPVRRGIYSGALGYLDARGGADLSVVIRTALVHDGWVRIHVGGGIVVDSDPAAEWQESLDKARALLDAVAEVAPADAGIR